MEFIKTNEMKIELTPNQQREMGRIERINEAFLDLDVLSLDIYHEGDIIGFAQIREYDKGCFFLWHYGIDLKYQNQGLGTKALVELISYLKKNYSLIEMTTTYLFGNLHAKHVYEKIGFIETDIVDEEDIHEVNMIYKA